MLLLLSNPVTGRQVFEGNGDVVEHSQPAVVRISLHIIIDTLVSVLHFVFTARDLRDSFLAVDNRGALPRL